MPASLNSLDCNIVKPVKFLKATGHSCRLASGRPPSPCGYPPLVNVSALITNVSLLSLPPDRSPDFGAEIARAKPKVVKLLLRVCHGGNCRENASLPATRYDLRTGRCLDALAAITFRIGYNATQGIRYASVDLQLINATAGI